MGARAGARGGSDPVRTTRGPPWPVFRAPAARAPPRGLAWPRSAAGARCSRSASARRAGASGEGGCAGYAGPRDTRPTSSAKRGAPPASRARPAPRNVCPRRGHAPRTPRRSQLVNRSCCGPAGARGWEPARMACGLPASALFWAPRSHAWTHAAAFVQHVNFGHVWRRSSSQAGAAAPVSGSKNRSRHAPQDCPRDGVHPRTRVDAGAAPKSGKIAHPVQAQKSVSISKTWQTTPAFQNGAS